jgi:tRNA U55 pseudouridine synthase TruB
LRVNASKGTYVRVLAFDLAVKLGSLGTMSALKRVKTAGVEIDQCIDLESLTSNVDMFEKVLLNIDTMPLEMLRLKFNQVDSNHLIHGRNIHLAIDQIDTNNVESPSTGFNLSQLVSPITALLFDEKNQVIGIGEVSRDDNNTNLIKVRKKRGL